MNVRVFLLLAVIGGFFASSASAQDSLVEYVKNSCEAEIATYCPKVTLGNGRMMLCFAAHEDHLSERCEYALYQASAALEQAVAAIAYVGRSCRADIEQLCPETQPGDGRVLECLDGQKEKVSETCRNAVADVTE